MCVCICHRVYSIGVCMYDVFVRMCVCICVYDVFVHMCV